MISAARQAYPDLRFEVADARDLPFEATFDAVFSNAALHWIHEPEPVVRNIWKSLRPVGRFVAELGGKGNVQKLKAAMDHALGELRGPGREEINLWYFPSVSEYASLLETHGFVVRFITLFDRPTPLADGEMGLRNWIVMFCAGYLDALQPEFRESFLRRVEDLLRPDLFRDGQWCADYRRLRVMALK
jgi:trans-aconitate 2-methyltransferase